MLLPLHKHPTPFSLSPSCWKTNQKPLQRPRLNQAGLGLVFSPSWKSHLLNKASLILLSSSFNTTQRLWLIFLSSQCTVAVPVVLSWDSSLAVLWYSVFSNNSVADLLWKSLYYSINIQYFVQSTQIYQEGKSHFITRIFYRVWRESQCWDFISVHQPPWMIVLLMTYTLHQPRSINPFI